MLSPKAYAVVWPFDFANATLRANGAEIEIVGDFPFVLSLSKHEHHFFSTLLGLTNREQAERSWKEKFHGG